jgi:anaerobic selenocysteine-containing dehydrogenase
VYGIIFNADPGPKTGLLLLWGFNPIGLMGGELIENIRAATSAGARVMVIDPKRIQLAKKADLWINPRPQSDGALAMGIIKVIIEEKRYDADFVSKWTVGFKELEEEIKNFSLDDVEKATWVPKAQIEKAARMLTDPKNQPVCYFEGNGLERSIHSFQAMRALYILRALLGSLNVPGGNTLLTPAPFARMGRFYFPKGNDRKMERGLCSPFRVGMPHAYVPPQSFVRAILDEKPYPIKAAINILTNPMVSYPDSEATYRALMKLEFFVVSELFPTPTSAVADIVLPAAWGSEHDAVGYWPGWQQGIRAYPKIVEPPGKAKPNAEWINELAKRVGLRQYFWDKWEDSMDEILEPAGITFEQLKKKRFLEATKDFRKPEDGVFRTPSGKVELYSQALKQQGYPPIPTFKELTQFCFEPSEEYPLLMFNGKEAAYMNNGYKHVKLARALKPYPTVDMHPETAKKLGLKEDEWIYIETRKGRVKQILKLDADLHPKLVFPSMGWWFPEEPNDLFQFRKSNINVLTQSEPPYDPEVGAVELGSIPCRVYKAD